MTDGNSSDCAHSHALIQLILGYGQRLQCKAFNFVCKPKTVTAGYRDLSTGLEMSLLSIRKPELTFDDF